MKKIFIALLIVAIIAILFISLSKKEKMITVYTENYAQKPLPLKLHHLQDPQCAMVVESETYATQVAAKDGKTWIFDDIGCMVLWLDKHKFDSTPKLWVHTIDSNEWIEADMAYYHLGKHTPMHHGFGAYKRKKEGYLTFSEVRDRILRGEDLTNPLIRKKILGL